jgi:dihydrofolate synthase/folylpolyglutamate synthase
VKTGLYTSPHLARFAERIRLGGAPIDDAALTELLADSLRREPTLTFFEIATLAAFRAFRAAKVELAVLEVGLGGRLDATNVVPKPRAAAITRIALDHTDRLGTTLESIAREKAGIAKPGLEIVLGAMSREVRAAIDEVAHAAGATTLPVDEDAGANGFTDAAKVGLAGTHQRENAKIAYVLGARIGATHDERVRGIASVVWPGRLETLETPSGAVLLDAAHNPDGIDALVSHLGSIGASPEHVALVFGVLADKAWAEMLDRLAPAASQRFYVCPVGRPAVDPSLLAERHAGVVVYTTVEALTLARKESGPSGLVVVCGSILLVGEARALLLNLSRDPPVAL